MLKIKDVTSVTLFLAISLTQSPVAGKTAKRESGMIYLSMIHLLNPVESAFLLPIDPDYNARNLRYLRLRNGRIFVSVTFKDDGPEVNRGERMPYPDFPLARLLANESDFHAWKSAIPSLLKAVKRYVTN